MRILVAMAITIEGQNEKMLSKMVWAHTGNVRIRWGDQIQVIERRGEKRETSNNIEVFD
uniref:Uncharacterized protein n=1 Tax=Rhizophora mucronata TaxID=61149 RepID=A0A2P2J4N0_RHIMU